MVSYSTDVGGRSSLFLETTWPSPTQINLICTWNSRVKATMVNVTEHGAKAHQAEVIVAQREAPQFEKVEWRKEPHLRKLYAYGCILMVASATTGYDG